jgi:endonuclease IV
MNEYDILDEIGRRKLFCRQLDEIERLKDRIRRQSAIIIDLCHRLDETEGQLKAYETDLQSDKVINFMRHVLW